MDDRTDRSLTGVSRRRALRMLASVATTGALAPQAREARATQRGGRFDLALIGQCLICARIHGRVSRPSHVA
jgi:hypothetical protein